MTKQLPPLSVTSTRSCSCEAGPVPWAAAYKSLRMKPPLCLTAILSLSCLPNVVIAAEFSNLVSSKMC